eukprot:3627452-Prymnesium_polylepis.1
MVDPKVYSSSAPPLQGTEYRMEALSSRLQDGKASMDHFAHGASDEAPDRGVYLASQPCGPSQSGVSSSNTESTLSRLGTFTKTSSSTNASHLNPSVPNVAFA